MAKYSLGLGMSNLGWTAILYKGRKRVKVKDFKYKRTAKEYAKKLAEKHKIKIKEY